MKGYVRYSIATASQLNQLEEIVKEWSAKYDLSKQRNTAETQIFQYQMTSHHRIIQVGF